MFTAVSLIVVSEKLSVRLLLMFKLNFVLMIFEPVTQST